MANKKLDAELTFRVMDVLLNSEEALNMDQIKVGSCMLSGLSSQKMTRLLGELVDKGLVVKAKSKSQGRMVYKSVSVIEYQEEENNEFCAGYNPYLMIV